MRKHIKNLVIFSIVSLVVLSSFNAAALISKAQSSPSSQLTIGLVGTPSDPFNPITQIALIDHWIQSILYATLVTYNTSGALVPYMASSFNVSADAKNFTFHLRNNLKWSDGYPITAQDVVFSLNASIEYSTRVSSLLPIAKPSSKTFSHYTLNTSDVYTPNNYTVIIHTSVPSPSLMAYFADFFYILPEHVDLGQNLSTNTFINSHVVTSGPWYLSNLSNYKPGSYMILNANPYFFLGPPKISTLVLQFFQTAESAEAALKSGSIQLMNNVPYADANTIKSSGFNIYVAPEMRVFFLQFNLNKHLADGSYNPISNLTVREALGYATNITALVSSVSSGYFKVWGQAEPYGMKYLGYPAWNSSLPSPQFPYNITKANELLNESGYVWHPGAPPRLNITLITLATIPYFVSAVQILKAEWALVGVNLNVKLEQTSNWVYDSFSAPQPKTWNIDLYDLTEPPDPFYPVNFLFGPGSGNAGNFTNPVIRDLIYNKSNTGNPVVRTSIFQQIDGIANKYVPYLFLATETEVDAWSTSINFNDGFGGVFFQILSIYNISYVTPTSSPASNNLLIIEIVSVAIVLIIIALAIYIFYVRRKNK
ncbi:MAG: ABC transporter substrate-binding protein [Thermoplasmata archaeon]